MKLVALQAVPSQNLSVNLNSQPAQINVYLLGSRLFLDLSVNNVPILTGQMVHDRNKIVRDAYLGFVGDLTFVDTQGADDPVYTGLGTRFLLVYLEASDL